MRILGDKWKLFVYVLLWSSYNFETSGWLDLKVKGLFQNSDLGKIYDCPAVQYWNANGIPKTEKLHNIKPM